LKRAAAAILGAGAIFALAGCGTGDVVAHGDTTHGKTLFQQKCQACHTLAAANATGTVGPNLDTAFAFVRDAKNPGDRFCEVTIANVVRDQIRFPSQNNIEPTYIMPANLVTGQDADDVAQYVASVAGIPPGGKAPKQSDKC
jgi:mono/diheme cytochrome c family protein